MIQNSQGFLRKSIRLKGRDYRAPDAYFVTICAHERRCIFGHIVSATLVPNALGRIVRECWVVIPLHFAHVELHEFVVMPNHLHGIIAIMSKASAPPVTPATAKPLVGAQHRCAPPVIVAAAKPLVGAQHCCALPPCDVGQAVMPGSLGAIVRSFKAIVARRAHEELRWKGPIWERNYFERVLRDGKEFSDVSQYIAENPMRWEWDSENPQRKLP